MNFDTERYHRENTFQMSKDVRLAMDLLITTENNVTLMQNECVVCIEQSVRLAYHFFFLLTVTNGANEGGVTHVATFAFPTSV